MSFGAQGRYVLLTVDAYPNNRVYEHLLKRLVVDMVLSQYCLHFMPSVSG